MSPLHLIFTATEPAWFQLSNPKTDAYLLLNQGVSWLFDGRLLKLLENQPGTILLYLLEQDYQALKAPPLPLPVTLLSPKAWVTLSTQHHPLISW